MITQVILIGVLTGFLSLFINYCLGKPGSKEFSPYEVLSFYTVWLSKRRLKQIGLWGQYRQQYLENMRGYSWQVISFKKDFNKMIYEAAEQYFTWERALGMCVVCSGFWISLITGLFFTFNFVNLFTITLISHITIRLLNRAIT